MKINSRWLWLPKILAAIIMLQTLFFKLTAAPESVYIFSTLGLEPVGRIGAGAVELTASILLLIPGLAYLGAALGLGTMLGAIFSHLFVLGLSVQGDGGYLFALALIVAICCLIVAYVQRNDYSNLVKVVTKKLQPLHKK